MFVKISCIACEVLSYHLTALHCSYLCVIYVPFGWVSGRSVEAASKQCRAAWDRTSMGCHSWPFPRQKWRSVSAKMGEGRESGIGQRTMDKRGKLMKLNSYLVFISKDEFTHFLFCIPLYKVRNLWFFYYSIYIDPSLEVRITLI